MNKLKTFFASLFKSSTQPTYGNDIVRASGGFTFKYFLFFTFLTALVTTGVFVVPLSQLPMTRIANEISSLYPTDLAVTMDPVSGLSINQPLPYTIFVPEDVAEPGQQPEMIPLVTFASESADLTFEKIASFNSVLVVTEKNLYARREEEGRFEVTPLPEVEERFTFDRALLDKGLQNFLAHPFIKDKMYVPFLAVFLFAFVFPGLLVMRGLTAVIYAAVAWIIAMIFMKAKNVSYGKMLQLSLHTLTPVVIGAYIVDFAGYTFLHGWVYFIVYLVWTLVMVAQLRPAGVNSAPVVTTPTPTAVALKTAAKPTRKRKVASKR